MRARAGTIALVLMVALVTLILMSRTFPSKPVAKAAAEPGISHLEDLEIGRGMLHVIKNNVSGQLFGLYDIPGRDPVIAPLGEAVAR